MYLFIYDTVHCAIIYIYIYIIHKQIVSLYHDSSIRLDTWNAPTQDRDLPNFLSGWLHTRGQASDSTSAGELTHMYQISFVYILRSRMPKGSIR